MRRLLVSAFFLAVCGCAAIGGPADAPVEVAGVLNGKTVLRGHVVVSGDILVPPGAALIVRPGTTLHVRGSESTKIDPEYLSPQTELLVRGTLLVDGTKSRPVTFLPESPAAGSEPAWAGIILDNAAGSAIRHARIVQPETGIQIIGGSPEIVGNRITSARYGIVIQGGAAKILDNEITRGEGGIFCWRGAAPYLKGNSVIANDEEGIVVDRSSRPYIDRNTVSGNDIGLVIPAGLPYDPFLVRGNREDVRILDVRKRGEE